MTRMASAGDLRQGLACKRKKTPFELPQTVRCWRPKAHCCTEEEKEEEAAGVAVPPIAASSSTCWVLVRS